MVAGLEEISEGELKIGDRVVNNVAPRNRDIAMVFQSYALYPHLTVYDNIAFGLKLRKMDKQEIDKRVKDAARVLDLEPFLDRKPRALSGGQRQRVAIARALASRPSLLIADEPVSMLDVSIRLGVLNLLRDLKERLNLAILYITHDIASARYFADETLVMYAGRLVEGGDSETVTQNPAHPYTRLLIESAPDPDRLDRVGDLRAPEDQGSGEPPSLIAPPSGCRFHPRCVHAMPKCSTELPPRFDLPTSHDDSRGHWAACWLYEEGAAK
jgi:peptide/nickel transport system ATP-binding protein